MLSLPCVEEKVIGGIDTHKDLHFAAVVDVAGAVLGTRAFATTRAGSRALLTWMRSFGRVEKVGVEQTGFYGAGVVRHLALAGIPVLEVTGPDTSDRRTRGKDDAIDAVAAARAALTGKRVSVAKHRDGRIKALRVLRTTRQTAVKARRAAPRCSSCATP
jgi:transposase